MAVETKLMNDIPSFINMYTVYNNHTNTKVLEGTWPEVEAYADQPEVFTVVSQANGMIVN